MRRICPAKAFFGLGQPAWPIVWALQSSVSAICVQWQPRWLGHLQFISQLTMMRTQRTRRVPECRFHWYNFLMRQCLLKLYMRNQNWSSCRIIHYKGKHFLFKSHVVVFLHIFCACSKYNNKTLGLFGAIQKAHLLHVLQRLHKGICKGFMEVLNPLNWAT